MEPTATIPSTVPLNAASLIRLAAALLAGFLVSHGFSGDQASAIAGGALALAVGLWSIWKNSQVQKKIAVAMASPAVKVVDAAGATVVPRVVAMLAALIVVGLAAPWLSACKTAPLASPSTQLLLLQGDTALDLTWNEAMRAWIAAGPKADAATRAKVHAVIVRGYALVQAVDKGQLLAGETDLAAELVDAQTAIALIGMATGH